MTPSPIPPAVRAVLVISLCTFMFIGPLLEQVFSIHSPWIRSWVMYRVAATDICWADFYEVGANGDQTTIDRYKTLGHSSRWTAPTEIRWMRNTAGVHKVSRLLCTALGDNTDIRAYGNCAKMTGWEVTFRGQNNLCVSTQKSPPEKSKPNANNSQKKKPNPQKKGNKKTGKKKNGNKTSTPQVKETK